MSFSPPRRFTFLALALGATLVLAATPLAAQASVSNPTTKSVLSAAKTAVGKESGVHIHVSSTSGTSKSTVLVDIGATYGEETIVTGNSTVKIIVTPTDAYLSGSKTGLTTIMGLSAAEQKKVGTLSIAMKAGTAPYKSFHANLTTAVLTGILPASTGTKFKYSSDTNKDYQLTWSVAATSTTAATTSVMTISSGSKTLPIKEVITGTTGGGTTKFSKWGEHVTENAPAKADTIAYAKVVG